MKNDPIIRIADIRNAGYCTRGARRWFEAHDLDFKQFLAEGIRASELIEKGDGLARKVVAKKLEKEQPDGRR